MKVIGKTFDLIFQIIEFMFTGNRYSWTELAVREPNESMPVTLKDVLLEDQRRQDMQRALNHWAFRYSEEAFAVWNDGSVIDPAESPSVGALGIHGSDLLFVPAYDTPTGLTIPLHMIRWISHQNVSSRVGDFGPSPEALTIHCVDGDRWWIYSFSAPKAEQVAQYIQQQTQANYKVAYVIGGPISVRCKQQDIYGRWASEDRIMLYLAPDRLLSNFVSWIELRQIQRLALLPDNTLQITYHADALHIVGLVLAHDQAVIWSERLERATGLTMEDLAGRKKKSDIE